MKSISVVFVRKKIVATQVLKREICTEKIASKRKKTSHKNTANFPVMNVRNSPQLVYMDRLFHILPENVKSKTGSYLVQSGYSDFHC